MLRAGALGRPRGIRWGGRQHGGLGWGTLVNPWLIHVNIWQKPLQYCKVISLQLIKINEKKKKEPHEQYERAKRQDTEDEPPRLVSAQYAAGDQWRNNSRKNEGMEPKQKQHPVVNVTGDGNKVRCCKEQYCIGTWNVRSMNQGKLEVVKQEMARVNINILRIIKLKWTRMGEFNSDDHYIYYCGQESLRRNGVAIIVNKRV